MSYDDNFIKETNNHELQMAMEKTKQLEIKTEQRRKIIIFFILVIGTSFVLLGITFAIWSNINKTRTDEYNKLELKHQQTMVCTEKGGTILTVQSGEGCFFLKNPDGVN